jgi:hypothetical protein
MKRKVFNQPDENKYGQKEGLYVRTKTMNDVEYEEEDFIEFAENVFLFDEEKEHKWFTTVEQYSDAYRYYFGLNHVGNKKAVKELFKYSDLISDTLEIGIKRISYIDNQGEKKSKTARVILNMKFKHEQSLRNTEVYENALNYEKQLKDLMIKLYKDKELNFDYELLKPAHKSLRDKIENMEKENGTASACETDN